MIMLIFLAILSVIINVINCNKTDNYTVLTDTQKEVGLLTKEIFLKCPILINETETIIIIWKYDNVTITTLLNSKKYIKSNKRIKALDDGSLFIKNLLYEDAKSYTCERYGTRLLSSIKIDLIVRGPPINFINFAYEALFDYTLKISWETNITEKNIVKSYNISICLSLIDKKCQYISLFPPASTYTFLKLEPFTAYRVSIIAINDIGTNKLSTLTAITKPGTPDIKPFLRLKSIFGRNVTLHIECSDCLDSKKVKGPFKMFVISYEDRVGPVIINVTTNQTIIEKTIFNLHPFKNYTFFVAVSNGFKSGDNTSITCQTKEDYPNPTSYLRTTDILFNEINVKWNLASDDYGPVTGYLLTIIDGKGYEHEKKVQVSLNRSDNEYRFVDLKPRHPYTIQLVTLNNVGSSSYAEINEQTDRAYPSTPRISHVTVIPKFVRVAWNNVFPPTDLTPLIYEICWSASVHIEYNKKCIEVTSTATHDIKCSCEPNSTVHSVDIPVNRVNLNDSKLLFSVTVMIQSDMCNRAFYCRNLKATSDVFVLEVNDFMRYHNQEPRTHFTRTIVILSIISAAIFVTGFSIVFCFCGNRNIKEMFLTRHPHNYYSRPPGEYTEVYPREASQPKIIPLEKTPHPPIEVNDLVQHIMRYRCDDGAGFQTEFEAIELMDNSGWSITYPNRKENKIKNRYTNIFPYDHSRVVLQNPAHGKSDYINASFIDGYHRRNAYIATQGPLPETIVDFWQMIYEQNSEIIVMITNFDERGRRKCEVYWTPNKIMCYGSISVHQIYEKKMAFYTERRFAIKNIRHKKNANKDRIVYHYQYTDWRDFDVPPSSLPVLVFVKATIKHWNLNSGPIIVHCSAGVGRTGTYICIESQIRQMEHEHKINVRGFLEHIRQQRMKLVQTESQYTFIHDALYEYYLCPDHDIRKDFFPNYIFQLKMSDCIGFSKQFQMCTQFEPTNYEYIECKRNYNLPKNRSEILPIDSRRINLSCEPGVEGSNYINASAIQGYWEMKEFIITQHPLEETEPDFWKMVWDENCTIIILLSGNNLPKFWPADENDFRTYPWSQVSYCNHEDNENVSKYGFLLSSQREDYNLNCIMYRLNQWPTTVSDSVELLHLLFTVNADKIQAPIVVVDDFGGFRAGTFVALSSLLNQLRNDDIVDVYFTMKMIHMERPHTFSSSDDLKFIYEVLEHVIGNQHSYSFFSNPVPMDFIPNGVCHQSSVTNKPGLNNGSFVPHYATLNTIKSKSSSSSATFRRRASSAESEPFCPSPHNRISWNPVETTRYSLMDWSTTSMMTGNGGHQNGYGGTPVQIIANPISVSDLPVAKIVSNSLPMTAVCESSSNTVPSVTTTVNLGDSDDFDCGVAIISSDV